MAPGGLENSPIFDPVLGFGGNGALAPGNFTNPAPGLPVPPFDIPGHTGGGCIPNGPFKDFVVHLGPGPNVNPVSRCVRRDFAPGVFREWGGPANFSYTISQSTFGWLGRTAELTVHSAGHGGIGGLYGDMVDTYSSRKCLFGSLSLLVNSRHTN